MKHGRARIQEILEKASLWNDDTKKMMDVLTPRALGLFSEGAPSLRDAVVQAFQEMEAMERTAHQTHGSAFREERPGAAQS